MMLKTLKCALLLLQVNLFSHWTTTLAPMVMLLLDNSKVEPSLVWLQAGVNPKLELQSKSWTLMLTQWPSPMVKTSPTNHSCLLPVSTMMSITSKVSQKCFKVMLVKMFTSTNSKRTSSKETTTTDGATLLEISFVTHPSSLTREKVPTSMLWSMSTTWDKTECTVV